jgi:hypothetical protein
LGSLKFYLLVPAGTVLATYFCKVGCFKSDDLLL